MRFAVVDYRKGEPRPPRAVVAESLADLASVERWPAMRWETENDDAGGVWMVGRRGALDRVHVKVQEVGA